MVSTTLIPLINDFKRTYDAGEKDRIWRAHSERFRDFWNHRILAGGSDPISDNEADEIIRILDRNGKGNTRDSEAVAKAMVAQGAWRRMLNEFRTNKDLAGVISDIFRAERNKQAALIDKLYKLNEHKKNFLTGRSGNVISAFLAAYDPMANLSVISLKHRRQLIEFLEIPASFHWEKGSIGQLIVASNTALLDSLHSAGLDGSARTVSRFCYYQPMTELWKDEHTVRTPDRNVSVTVPIEKDLEENEQVPKDEIRESMQIQALIARIGALMGFSIWLPKGDRGRVLKAWTPESEILLEDLPLGYNATTMKTIEQIDVIWLKKRSIVRAFEVEHTTSVYSGLLRMADLVALQPDINIRLHIVAPAVKRDKVMQEIRRPVFSLLEGRALSEICTFLSYDSVKSIAEEKHLAHLSDTVITDYEERADPE